MELRRKVNLSPREAAIPETLHREEDLQGNQVDLDPGKKCRDPFEICF